MSMEGPNIPDRMKSTVKTVGDSWRENTKKMSGILEVAIGKRDSMKIRRGTGVPGKLSRQVLMKTWKKKGIIIEAKIYVTLLIEFI